MDSFPSRVENKIHISNTSTISKIYFGLSSSEDIIKQSVCELHSTKMSGLHSVYDERMGVLESFKTCPQCGLKAKECTGHFGHICLQVPILHPLFYKHAMAFLKCICYKCCRLLLSEELVQLYHLHRIPVKQRFWKLLDRLGKSTYVCSHCHAIQPKYIMNHTDKTIYMVFNIDHEIHRIPLYDWEILGVFERLPDSDIALIGYTPISLGESSIRLFHPKNFVLTVLPVLPPIARPYVMSETVTCDDDLTVQYMEILKTNNHLKERSLHETKRQKYIQILKFRIKSLFDNSSGSSKHSNGRPLKGIKKRLTGKEGLIRNNLMGKRVDKSARSVIGPDPTLRCDEIAIPPEIAKILQYRVQVNQYNMKQIQQWIDQDLVHFILRDKGNTRIHVRYAKYKQGTKLQNGDWIFRKHPYQRILITSDLLKTFTLQSNDVIFRPHESPPNQWITNVELPIIKPVDLRIGDVIERPLQNGDILLLNRQPTLHKGSMIAQTVCIRPGKTIRMNLATTKTFNADFDGDEMNLHCPASVETECELRELSSLKNHLMSTQSSKPNIVIVQDALLGAYLLTKYDKEIPRHVVMNMVMSLKRKNQNEIEWWEKKCHDYSHFRQQFPQHVFSKRPFFNGQFVFSLLFPRTFCYGSIEQLKTLSSPTCSEVIVYHGLLIQGHVTKRHLGSSQQSFIKWFHIEYGSERTIQFIDEVQFLTLEFISYHGFSVGISDCLVTKQHEIDNVISKAFLKAERSEVSVQDVFYKEMFVSQALSGARDTGMMIATRSLESTNRFVTTVTCGSKGDYFNIAQITGVIGQQFLNGERIKPCLTYGRRTLPHYPLDGLPKDPQERYASQGFVRHSFIHGMNPTEWFFHAMTGREGITDTAMKTATSGYIQRRMVKMTEDVQIKYDGTVRNAHQDIIQFTYGSTHTDPCESIIDDQGNLTLLRVDKMVAQVLASSHHN